MPTPSKEGAISVRDPQHLKCGNWAASLRCYTEVSNLSFGFSLLIFIEDSVHRMSHFEREYSPNAYF